MKTFVPGFAVASAIALGVGGLSGDSRAAEVTASRDGWIPIAVDATASAIYADGNVAYWLTPFVAAGDVRTVITGTPPQARFWAFQISKTQGGVISEIHDEEVLLDSNGSYRITIADDCSQVVGDCLSTTADPQPTVAQVLIYRLTLPSGGADGSAPLPKVTYELPGEGGEIDLTAAELPPAAREALDAALLAQAAARQSVLRTASPVHYPVAEPDNDPAPQSYDFTSFDKLFLNYLRFQRVPPEVVDAIEPSVPTIGSGSFFKTKENKIQYAFYDMMRGNLVVRAKAPTYRRGEVDPMNDLARSDDTEQLRYWGLCTVTIHGLTVNCTRDELVMIPGDESDFEIVVAPSCPVAGYDNCLASGNEAMSFAVVYRNQLASDDFENEQLQGDYALRAEYVARP